MRVLVTADIHCGYPQRNYDIIWALKNMYDYAYNNNIEKIIVLGDLFHNRETISIDTLNYVSDFFKCSKDIEWIVFPGNHDMFMKESWDINSVSPFGSIINNINSISEFKVGGRRFVVLPFIHFEDRYNAIVKYLESKYDEDDVLLTHIGVNNAVNNSCFLLKHWSVVNFTDCKFNLVLSGHFHNHQVIDNKVCYPGSPIPFKFDEGMVPHGFIDLDVDNLYVKFVSLQDRDDYPMDFVTIGDDRLNKLNDNDVVKLCKRNKVRVVLGREYGKSELDLLRDKLLQCGSVGVSWMKIKQFDDDHNMVKVDIKTDIFKTWIDSIDVSNYNVDLLLDLHQSVVDEADDIYIKSMEDDNE